MKKEKVRLIIIWAAIIIMVSCVFMDNYMLTAQMNYGIVNENNEISDDNIAVLKGFEADAICVLGGGLDENGKPGKQLKDRLDAAYTLYEKGLAKNIILTGADGEDKNGVNEVKAMEEYMLSLGAPSEVITVDGKGYSTFDSMYHLANSYNLKKAIVVTQGYHIARATYIANVYGIEACGVIANQNKIENKFWFTVRENLARIKDFPRAYFKTKSKNPIESVDLTGYTADK